MTRFNEVIELVSVVGTEVDDCGNQVLVTETKTVFANRYTLGLASWAAARSTGLHADSQYSVRSSDYDGQQRVVVEGVEYEVENVSDKGEFTALTLRKRLPNG